MAELRDVNRMADEIYRPGRRWDPEGIEGAFIWARPSWCGISGWDPVHRRGGELLGVGMELASTPPRVALAHRGLPTRWGRAGGFAGIPER
jgi:hypothetical protein